VSRLIARAGSADHPIGRIKPAAYSENDHRLTTGTHARRTASGPALSLRTPTWARALMLAAPGVGGLACAAGPATNARWTDTQKIAAQTAHRRTDAPGADKFKAAHPPVIFRLLFLAMTC
jgi:hypothetical protein